VRIKCPAPLAGDEGQSEQGRLQPIGKPSFWQQKYHVSFVIAMTCRFTMQAKQRERVRERESREMREKER
jgi:hypothetical protein